MSGADVRGGKLSLGKRLDRQTDGRTQQLKSIYVHFESRQHCTLHTDTRTCYETDPTLKVKGSWVEVARVTVPVRYGSVSRTPDNTRNEKHSILFLFSWKEPL